jgi:RNA polymerase sigma factor (sigma-70 family)
LPLYRFKLVGEQTGPLKKYFAFYALAAAYGRNMNEHQSDFERLQAFARHGDQDAFASLVRRHLDLVYATAFRKAEDPGAAEEIAQNVFAALVKKAWQFAPDDSLPAWLYKTTLLESREWLRGELRRRRREQTAAELGTTMRSPDEQAALRALVPLLDEALLSLREKDRTALLLRFYEKQSLREVGASLGVGEGAAQKRVASALEKLSGFFQRRGYKTATVAAAAAALEHTAVSAPAVVANSVVVATAKLAPPALLGLTGLLTRLVGLTRLQTAAVCLALAAAPLIWQWEARRQAGEQATRLRTQLKEAQTELLEIQTQIDRLNETSTRLAAAAGAAAESARRIAQDKEKFDAWRTRLRRLLTSADYHWPDDSPFVRIPKSAVRQIDVHHPVLPPGVLKREARELFGLTPEERERLEGALQRHFRAIDDIIESRIYETNRPSRLQVPASAAASAVWVVPPLGEQAKASGQELQATWETVLAGERSSLVGWLLVTWFPSTDTLRRVLNLDANKDQQELAVWVQNENDNWLLGYGFSSGRAMTSTSGISLEKFAPTADPATGANASGYAGLDEHVLPDPLARRIRAWIQQQTGARLGKDPAK